MPALVFSLFALCLSLFSLFYSYTSSPKKMDDIENIGDGKIPHTVTYFGSGKIPDKIMVDGQQVFEKDKEGNVTIGSSFITLSRPTTFGLPPPEYDSTELDSFDDPKLTVESLKEETSGNLHSGDYTVDSRGVVRKIRTARHEKGQGSYILYFPHRVYLKELDKFSNGLLVGPNYTINGSPTWTKE